MSLQRFIFNREIYFDKNMKQKLIDGKLYFQETTAQVIDITGAEIDTVYVPFGTEEAYKELNPDMNIQPYNYNVLSAKTPFWYVPKNGQESEEPIVDPVQPTKSILSHSTCPLNVNWTSEPSQNVSLKLMTIYDSQYIFSSDDWDASSYPEGNITDISFYSMNASGMTYELDIYISFTKYGNNSDTLTLTFKGNNLFESFTEYLGVYVSASGESELPPLNPTTTYSFVSYDSTGTTYYGYGKVQTTENTANGRTQVLVTENSVEGWAGNYYWVDSNATPGDDILYPLYEASDSVDNNGVAVKVYYEGMIPSNVIPSENPTPEQGKITPSFSFSFPTTIYNCQENNKVILYNYVYNPDNVAWQFTSASVNGNMTIVDIDGVVFTQTGTYDIYAETIENETYSKVTYHGTVYMTTEQEPVV